MWNRAAFIIVFFGWFISANAFAGGTVIGNGGDPVFEFLEAARASMVGTLEFIINQKSEKDQFCQSSNLNPAQIQFCHDFFLSVVGDVLALSHGSSPVPFVLRDQPLYVDGPDGKPMVVAARTDLGPSGPIEFERDSVKTMAPVQVLFLMTHEFQHKANYQGRFVADNEAIGPFASGRDLIDAVAHAVVDAAKRHGKVGTQFGIRDIFDCTIQSGSAQFGARISATRLFLSDDLMSYETSVGKDPSDDSISLPESPTSKIFFRLDVHEPNNCGDVSPQRQVAVEIVRATRQSDGSFVEAVLANQVLTANPICSGSPPRVAIRWDRVSFTCDYFGSQGTTASMVSVFPGGRGD